MDSIRQALIRSPELFPAAMDGRGAKVALIRLTEADYAIASFLDGRLFTPTRLARTVPYAELEVAVAEGRLAERCHYIFHIGHVGSTLLSRLLGAHPAFFSLREPQILRDLAAAPVEARLTAFLKLWSRTFRPEQTALIKATSFVSELAPALMLRPPKPRALLMFVPAEIYLATILAGENAAPEAATLAPTRLARLQARLGASWDNVAFSPAETIAMTWACEMTALLAAAGVAGKRALWLDFERYLAAPRETLAKVFVHFGLGASETALDSILAGPDTRRYAKAPEHAYDAELRVGVLNQARDEYADEIARGLAWLDRAAKDHRAIADVMALSGGMSG